MATEGNRRASMFSEFSKAKQMEWKRKILVFSFFLSISVVIWLLNALSKNYTTEIKYPISYSKFPDHKVLVSDVPDHLGLKVNAHGYALLSYKLTNRPIPINFQLSSFAMNHMAGDSSKFFLLTRYAREDVARQLPGELQLLEISPDSLIFQFATEVSRKVAVKPLLSYELNKDFTIMNGIRISPDSILIYGPDIFLDTLQFIRTKQKSLGLLEKSYTGILDLDTHPHLKYENSQVECTMELEKLTEIQVLVPVQISGLPDSLRLQTFPHLVKVTGKIGLSKYTRIVPESFWIEVMYEEVLENKKSLQVHLRTKPNDLSGVDFYPRTVEYLLSVK